MAGPSMNGWMDGRIEDEDEDGGMGMKVRVLSWTGSHQEPGPADTET